MEGLIGLLIVIMFVVGLAGLGEAFVEYEVKSAKQCSEMKCCFDDSWGYVVCKNWETQVKL